jgi:hypothetical protein
MPMPIANCCSVFGSLSSRSIGIERKPAKPLHAAEIALGRQGPEVQILSLRPVLPKDLVRNLD